MNLRLPTRLPFAVLCAVLFALQFSGLGFGQGKRVRHLEIGVTMDRPEGYQPLPIPRSEPLLKLSFVRREPGSLDPITWSLFRVEMNPASSSPYSNLRAPQFLAGILRAEAVGAAKDLTKLGDYKRMRQAFERDARRGILFGFLGEQFNYYLVGESPSELYDDEMRLWRKWAGELRIQSPKRNARERASLERRYSGTRLTDHDRRIAARLSLVGGWKAYDGDQYIYLVHGLDSQAWKVFDKELMGVRRYLTENLLTHDRFAPEDVGVIRLCKDRTEYLDFGGVPEAAGYFSPVDDELVMHNTGGASDDEGHTVLAVMRHESFHQYVYSALGGISPHMWFDEGYGELMASAEVGAKRVVGFSPLVHHQRTLAERLDEGGLGLKPLSEFFYLSRADFYADARVNYAQAWILVEFLVHSDYGKRSSRGADFIRDYVRRLREGWAARLEGASKGQPIHMGTLDEVRNTALIEALKKLDLAVLEPAFQRFVKESVAFVPR